MTTPDATHDNATTEPATPDWLAAIAARLAARTPGEWIKALGSHNNFVVRQESRELLATITSRPDADLIAHAPADIERLLAEVTRLRAVDVGHADYCPECGDRVEEGELAVLFRYHRTCWDNREALEGWA